MLNFSKHLLTGFNFNIHSTIYLECFELNFTWINFLASRVEKEIFCSCFTIEWDKFSQSPDLCTSLGKFPLIPMTLKKFLMKSSHCFLHPNFNVKKDKNIQPEHKFMIFYYFHFNAVLFSAFSILAWIRGFFLSLTQNVFFSSFSFRLFFFHHSTRMKISATLWCHNIF